MKLIIAGGRNYDFTDMDWERLRVINMAIQITEVVGGGATGADEHGRIWARHHEIPFKLFPADWDGFGKAAGPIRNQKMAAYSDAAALFPGGKGTQSMYDQANRYGLKIFDFRNPSTGFDVLATP